MSQSEARILSIKKLKKDGSLDKKLLQTIISFVESKKNVILPVDCIYTGVSISLKKISTAMKEVFSDNTEIVWLISNFKMLDDLAVIDKLEFDFLHRIWPGEITVCLQSREDPGKKNQIRIPRNKYMLDIIEAIGKPLASLPVFDEKMKYLHKKNTIEKKTLVELG